METKKYSFQIIGLILIILGLYGLILSTVNTLSFSRYPTEGVYSIELQGQSYSKREEDCRLIQDLNQVGGMTEEKERAVKNNVDICWGGVTEERKRVMIRDFTQAVTFLTLGFGVIVLPLVLNKSKQAIDSKEIGMI